MKWYRLNQLRMELNEDEGILPEKIEKRCGFPKGSLQDQKISLRRESLDARNKKDIHRVCTVDFSWGVKLPPQAKKICSPVPKITLPSIISGNKPLTGRPIIIGFGPCGIFAALQLAEAGYAPIVIERGKAMEERIEDVQDFWEKGILDPESNVLFGEGGAGTFSDGKLTTGIKDVRMARVLADLAEAGAPRDILWQNKPHIGTDLLREVVVNLRHRIEDLGGEVHFETQWQGFVVNAAGELSGIILEKDHQVFEMTTNALILAPGHSARDTFRMLKSKEVVMMPKPFSIGVRMEHPQERIDHAQYGDVQGLPPATYKLSHKAQNGRGVYSFCMCPGGEVVSCSNQEGLLCVNGMSNRDRDSGTANAGILVDVRPSDFPSEDVLAGIDFQEYWEKRCFENGGGHYGPPQCTWGAFKNQEPSAKAVCDSLPDFAEEALREAIPVFGKKIAGFDDDGAMLTAVETRSSSPVRILRDEKRESNIPGIYPAGEGAGYAGGIMSAACDGLKAAEAIIRKFAPPEGS